MSTRCHIQVREANGKIYPVMIYKHSDGYPEGVLPFLKEFAEKFHKERGDDAEYCVAQILRHWAIEDFKQYSEPRYKDMFGGKNLALQFTGWGLCLASDPHGDVEHIYTVNLKTGKVRRSAPTKGMFKGQYRADVVI